MAFIEYTANPKNRTNDCIIRSIAKATERPWADVMKDMCDLSIELCLMPNDIVIANRYLAKRGWFDEMVPDRTMTVNTFCATHPTGRYVVLLADHALSVVDGDYYDLVECGNSYILNYWEVDKEA